MNWKIASVIHLWFFFYTKAFCLLRILLNKTTLRCDCELRYQNYHFNSTPTGSISQMGNPLIKASFRFPMRMRVKNMHACIYIYTYICIYIIPPVYCRHSNFSPGVGVYQNKRRLLQAVRWETNRRRTDRMYWRLFSNPAAKPFPFLQISLYRKAHECNLVYQNSHLYNVHRDYSLWWEVRPWWFGFFFYCLLAETQWHNLISDMKYIYGLFSKILELLVRVGRDTY